MNAAPGMNEIPHVVCNIRATADFLTNPQRSAHGISNAALALASQEMRNAAALIDLAIALRKQSGEAA
jgi:hypothetical protein